MDTKARARQLALAGIIEFRATTADAGGSGGKTAHEPAGSSKGGQFTSRPGSGSKSTAHRRPKKSAPAQSVPQAPAKPQLVKEGDSGEDVRYAQYAMSLLGFNVAQDGRFGPETAAAVKQMQQRLGVKHPNGHITPALLHKMQDAVRLSPCVGGGQRDLSFEAQWEQRDDDELDETAEAVLDAIDEFERSVVDSDDWDERKFNPAQPRDYHGRWSLTAAVIKALKDQGGEQGHAVFDDGRYFDWSEYDPATQTHTLEIGDDDGVAQFHLGDYEMEQFFSALTVTKLRDSTPALQGTDDQSVAVTSLASLGRADHIVFDDGSYIDWSVRNEDGSYSVGIRDPDGDEAGFDLTPAEFAKLIASLALSTQTHDAVRAKAHRAEWDERAGHDVSKELRIPSGKGGGRWTKNPITSAIAHALEEWSKGNGPDDPFMFDGKPIEREPLRKAAVARGISLKRGASREDIVAALKDDVKSTVREAKAAKSPEAGKPVRFTLKGHEPAGTVRAEGYSSAAVEQLRVVADGKGGYLGQRQDRATEEWHDFPALGTGNTPKDVTDRFPRGQWRSVRAPGGASKLRNLDVGVFTEPNGKVSLWEVSDSGQKRRRVALVDGLSGLQAWADEHGESELAGWARKERGGTEAPKAAKPAADVESKTRQAEIDAGRAVADALAQVDQLVRDQASDKALRHRIEHLPGTPDGLRRDLLAAAGDRSKLAQVADKAARDAGLTPVGRAGDTARYSRDAHEPMGGRHFPDGSPVMVVTQGFKLHRPDGEDVTLSRPKVMPLSDAEFAAAKAKAGKPRAEPLFDSSAHAPREAKVQSTADALGKLKTESDIMAHLDEAGLSRPELDALGERLGVDVSGAEDERAKAEQIATALSGGRVSKPDRLRTQAEREDAYDAALADGDVDKALTFWAADFKDSHGGKVPTAAQLAQQRVRAEKQAGKAAANVPPRSVAGITIDPGAPDFTRLTAVANAKTIADLRAVAAANNLRVPSYIKSKEDVRRHLALEVQYPAGMDFEEYQARFGSAAPSAAPDVNALRTLDTESRRDALDLRKVDDLKALLREQGLPVSGKKRDLVDRLVGHIDQQPETTRVRLAHQLDDMANLIAKPTPPTPAGPSSPNDPVDVRNAAKLSQIAAGLRDGTLSDADARDRLREMAKDYPRSVDGDNLEGWARTLDRLVANLDGGAAPKTADSAAEILASLPADLTPAQKRARLRSRGIPREQIDALVPLTPRKRVAATARSENFDEDLTRSDDDDTYDDDTYDDELSRLELAAATESSPDPTLDQIRAMAEQDVDRTTARARELALFGVTRALGHDVTPGHDELHHYWTVGPGRREWVDSPTPWRTLLALLVAHVKPPKPLEVLKKWASRWFIEVKGYAAGSDANRVAHGHPPRGHRVGPG